MSRGRAARAALIVCLLAAGVASGRPSDPSRSSSGATARGSAGASRAPSARRARPAPLSRIAASSELVPALSPESAPTRIIDGEPYVGANDLSRLLDATKFWRPDTRKLVLRARSHRVQLTEDNPFALVDDATVLLPVPVRSVSGALQIPVALLESLPRDPGIPRLGFDPARGIVFQVPPSGLVARPVAVFETGTTLLTFPVDRAEVVVASRSRAHFRVRFEGIFVGAAPESLPPGGLVRTVRRIPSVDGTAFELQVAPEAAGFRVIPEASRGRLTLEFASAPDRDLEPFAPEPPPGPMSIRIVVIDPGHGGADAGVSVEGMVEKDLTLALAKRVKSDVEHRLGIRVLLTRDDDRDLPVDQRAERANRARADLVVSLHFDGFATPRAHGATVYCAPAIYAQAEEAGGAEALGVLPWRDVALRHAVRSRDLADEVMSSLELRGIGPTRLREVLPYTLLGVNAPGILLECATLTSSADRGRLERASGLQVLSAAITDAIAAYQRHE